MATFATVTSLARSILDDTNGDVFSDSVLLNYANSAYRDLWQKLGSYGVKATVVTSSAIAVSSSSSEQNLTLPARLVVPLQLWEKGSGENDDQYIEMRLVDDLSTDQANATISEWKWENGAVRLRPVDNNRSVRIQYEGYQPDFSISTDPVLPPLAEDYLAWATAAMAARSRDQREFAMDLAQIAAESLRHLINNQVQANQRNLTRPLPYSGRTIR